MRILISIAFLALAIPSGFAQKLQSKPAGSIRYDKDGNFVTATFTYRVPLQPPVMGFLPGRPYSAEEISQQTQILPDGTRVVRPSPSDKFYRDSAGRTRTEEHPRSQLRDLQMQIDCRPEVINTIGINL